MRNKGGILLRAKRATLAKGERPGQTKTNSKHESSIRDFLKYAITVLYPIRSSWNLTGRWRTPNHIWIWKRNCNFPAFLLKTLTDTSCLKPPSCVPRRPDLPRRVCRPGTNFHINTHCSLVVACAKFMTDNRHTVRRRCSEPCHRYRRSLIINVL